MQKEKNNNFKDVLLLDFDILCSKIKRGMKEMKINGNTPISGQEKLSKNPLSIESNIAEELLRISNLLNNLFI